MLAARQSFCQNGMANSCHSCAEQILIQTEQGAIDIQALSMISKTNPSIKERIKNIRGKK